MLIRKALKKDFPIILKLAASLGLDYDGMEHAPFWLAEENGRILGIVSLLAHDDCRELVSLGVSPEARTSGLGRCLIEAVMDAAGTDVYLATVIPGYFERHGFVRTERVPSGMAKDPAWCEGCDKRLCAVMVRKRA
ncbi:MAG: GNAT family N-acetyltransferase [Candidatus Aminicenantes bacterium]|nr:GNAT family N-acetyltransferase [Candidatus Aminicenantes bacterium]